MGPEASLSLIVGQVITGIINADPHEKPGSEEAAAIAMAVSVIITLQVSMGVIVITGKVDKGLMSLAIQRLKVGLVTLFLGLCRLGFLDVVLSRALLRGFITAIVSVFSS